MNKEFPFFLTIILEYPGLNLLVNVAKIYHQQKTSSQINFKKKKSNNLTITLRMGQPF